MKARAWMAWACLLLVGCGSAASSSNIGDTHEQAAAEPFHLKLVDMQGEELDVADARGKLQLLYLFVTFDLPSQAAFAPLQEVAKQHLELSVIGIALQPNPRELLPIFASTLEVEIPLAYEPDNHLLQGLTELGRIESVPTYVLIDREGFVAKRITGALNADALRQWCGFE